MNEKQKIIRPKIAGKKTGEPILTVSMADVLKAKKEGKAIR